MLRFIKYFFIFILLFPIFLNAKERTGWGFGGVPALNYNADEGFGYGVVAQFFNYSTGGYSPYYYTIQPQIFFTTGGKQEHFIFFDSPYILGKGYRLNAEINYNLQDYYPYYGLGNTSEYHEEYTDEEDTTNYIYKYYYMFERKRISFFSNLTKAFTTHENGRPLFSALIGIGVINTKIGEKSDSSLLALDTPKGIEGGFTNYIKFGLIHDTRDNEPAPNSGHWTDVVVEFYSSLIGSDYNFSRWTFTDRRYFQIARPLVYAQRIVLETIPGDAPFYELAPYGSSFKVDEGLGGSKSLRGVLKNRYLGTRKLIMNFEFRYKFYEFSAYNQDFYLALNPFFDTGKVWTKNDKQDFSNLHAGYGAGLHIAWNENFIVAVDMGTSEETGLQLYIGLGYLY